LPPSKGPTKTPTRTERPTFPPSIDPTTLPPSKAPTKTPSQIPTHKPTIENPTFSPSPAPTWVPSPNPSITPSMATTMHFGLDKLWPNDLSLEGFDAFSGVRFKTKTQLYELKLHFTAMGVAFIILDFTRWECFAFEGDIEADNVEVQINIEVYSGSNITKKDNKDIAVGGFSLSSSGKLLNVTFSMEPMGPDWAWWAGVVTVSNFSFYCDDSSPPTVLPTQSNGAISSSSSPTLSPTAAPKLVGYIELRTAENSANDRSWTWLQESTAASLNNATGKDNDDIFLVDDIQIVEILNLVCWKSNNNTMENCTTVANEENHRRSTLEVEYRTVVLYSVILYLSDSSTRQLLADVEVLESEIAKSIESDAIAENVTVVSIVLESKTVIDVELVICPVYCKEWYTGCGTSCECEESLSQWIGMGFGCMTESSCPTPNRTSCSKYRECSSLPSNECQDEKVTHCIYAPDQEAPFCHENCKWENRSSTCEQIGKSCDDNLMICMDIEVSDTQMIYVLYPIIGCAVLVLCCILSWVTYKHSVSHRKIIAVMPSFIITTGGKTKTNAAVFQSQQTKREGEADFAQLEPIGTEILGWPDIIPPIMSEEYDSCPERLSGKNSSVRSIKPNFIMPRVPSAPLNRRAQTENLLTNINKCKSDGWSPDFVKFQLSMDDITEMDQKKIIGEGSFGFVVKGKYSGMVVAIKRFKAQWSIISEKEKADFRAEIFHGMELNHENIIRHYGYIEEPLSVVMEFCPYGSLNDYFSTVNVKLTPNEIWTDKMLKWTISAARGIAYLHSQGIIHRDIAARNLLLNKHLEIRVSDFGMARLLQIQDSDLDGSNQTITTVGPLKWMSPESLCNREYSFKTDIYSFGVTAWEIFTMCSEPYAELEPLQAAIEAVEKDRRPDLERITLQNVTLLELINLCWHKDPEKRPLMEKVILVVDKIIAQIQVGEYELTCGIKHVDLRDKVELSTLKTLQSRSSGTIYQTSI